jgi:hypothetical protein
MVNMNSDKVFFCTILAMMNLLAGYPGTALLIFILGFIL